MDNYSFPRRIWRIIYPPIIFIGIQIVITLVFAFLIAIAYGIHAALGGISEYDASAMLNIILKMVNDNTIIVVLACDVVSFSVFLPMFLKAKHRAELRKNRNPLLLAVLIAVFFAGFNIVEMVIFGLTDIMRFFPSYNEVTDLLSSGSLPLQIVAVGIAAPVAEETLFRGLLINRMSWLPAWAAVLIQAALFGLVHMNLFQGLYAFVAGILLGMIYIKYRSLIMVIAGHMAYNLTSILLSEFLTDETSAAVLFLSFAAAVICAVLLIRRKAAALTGVPAADPETTVWE